MPTDLGGGRVVFAAAEAVAERGTFPYSVTLANEAGAALPASAVSTVVAGMVAAKGGATVLAAGTNVKNTNGGTLSDGSFVLVLSGATLALQADEVGDDYAERRLTITFTATGAGGGTLMIQREVIFFLRNLREVS